MAEDSSFESTLDELENLFQLATEFVRDLRDLKNEEKLTFYGLFKQATEGPCTKRKPPIWDMKGCAKWEAWKGLAQMSEEDAMKNYINELTRINGNWEQCIGIAQTFNEEKEPTGHEGGMGISVSTLYNPDYEKDCMINDQDKTAFDWCKEGNIKEMTSILERKKVEANVQDDKGMTLLHWACDRGYQDIVEYLIKIKCDLNCQDCEGQTPLHYAVTCEFKSIVKTLVTAGAITNLTDNEVPVRP
ncbi:acyl-CoA-binding domain-containing protein 6-like isoform X2 [Dendronephthya gigantea]|uniref:acyl-CoA-binding domain-containing protein 6-like isoform X2 n=1 Tax=Dendronephthya gigantea TaxID=151771 RepID=UPI00106A29B3|nr:acyl-CoA-binding domain-containing protein 6-like isoform X2 [Dendronephthya gigantea]